MKIDVHSHIFDQRYFDAMWRDFTLERSTTPQGQTLMRRNSRSKRGQSNLSVTNCALAQKLL